MAVGDGLFVGSPTSFVGASAIGGYQTSGGAAFVGEEDDAGSIVGVALRWVAAAALFAPVPGWALAEPDPVVTTVLADESHYQPTPLPTLWTITTGESADVLVTSVSDPGEPGSATVWPVAWTPLPGYPSPDEFVPAAGTVLEADPGYQPLPPLAIGWTLAPLVDLGDTLVTQRTDDDPGYQPVTWPASWTLPAYPSADEFVPAAAPLVEEDPGYQPGLPLALGWVLPPLADPGESLVTTRSDDDPGYQPLGWATVWVLPAYPSADEFVPAASTVLDEDSGYQPSSWATVWTLPGYPSSDEFVPAAAPILDEDSGYQPGIWAGPWSITTGGGDPDLLSSLQLLDEPGFVPTPWAPVWNPLRVGPPEAESWTAAVAVTLLRIRLYAQGGPVYVLTDQSGSRYLLADRSGPASVLTDQSQPRYGLTDHSGPAVTLEDTSS